MSMQTIQFDIEDSKLDTFLTLMENLKDGMIKNLTVSNQNETDTKFTDYMKTAQFKKDKMMLQKRVADIESGKTACIPWDEGLDELDEFIHSVS